MAWRKAPFPKRLCGELRKAGEVRGPDAPFEYMGIYVPVRRVLKGKERR